MKVFRQRLRIIFALFVAGSAIIVSRAIYIQVLSDNKIARLSQRQLKSKILVRPRRGIIFDRNGEPLAVNQEINSLAANPNKIKNKKTMARLLAKALGVSRKKILKKISSRRGFVWITRHVSDKSMARLKKWGLIDSTGDLAKGLWLVKETRRTYPHGSLAAHVLGDVNIDSDGIEGVELWKNKQLTGKVISVKAVKDALGRPTFIDASAVTEVKAGENVHLTIDASLQYEVEQELKAAVKKTGAKGGTVIVMDASSGEILAMANRPVFNPNGKKYRSAVRRNRAVTDGYEPGSTMKPLLVAAALDQGWKINQQIWGGLGRVEIQNKTISEAEADEKFEWLTLGEVIKYSSNVGSAKLAIKLGRKKFRKKLYDLGFGSKTALGFPGEISGMLLSEKKIKKLRLATMGFGQGILTTRLQMVRAYAALLNGGWLIQPTLIKDKEHSKPKTPKRVFSKKDTQRVVRALIETTSDEGTGKKARLEGYLVAGKTGTSQVIDPKTRRYSRTHYIASFVGFAVGVEPRLVIFTSLDRPQGIYYASETAAPLFSRVLSAVVSRYSMESLPTELAELKKLTFGRKRKKITDRIVISKAHPMDQSWKRNKLTLQKMKGSLKMPDLTGLSLREVISTFRGHEFDIQALGGGLVTKQTPSEGTLLTKGDRIKVHLSRSRK